MLWILVVSIALVTSIVDERSRALDKEYEEVMGEKVESLEGEETKEEEPKQDEADVGLRRKFNPHEDLHNEEFTRWSNGEPYLMKNSHAKTGPNGDGEGYVCQQFTLPQDEGVSLTMLPVKDLYECKCACNERRGKAKQEGHVGCNAFAYLAGQNVKAEDGVTVNECHLKRHFMYHEDWVKVVNPWIFCVMQGAGSGDFPVEAEVATPYDMNTVHVAATSAFITSLFALGSFYVYNSYRSKTKTYMLLDDEI